MHLSSVHDIVFFVNCHAVVNVSNVSFIMYFDS